MSEDLPTAPDSPFRIDDDLIELYSQTVEGCGHTVLFVDDEPDALFMLRGMFRDSYDVLTADTGTEALALMAARSEPPVCVIASDQMMPGMTGIELLGKVGKLYPHCVRLLFTAFGSDRLFGRALEDAHVQGYESKPIDMESFVRKIRKAVAWSLVMQRWYHI